MIHIDYCRLMKGIQARPEDNVPITLRQFLELRLHIKECGRCSRIVDDMNAKHPPKPFGLGNRQAN